jgi:hypothetical protein
MPKFQLADFFTAVSDSLFNAFFVAFYSQPEDAPVQLSQGTSCVVQGGHGTSYAV